MRRANLYVIMSAAVGVLALALAPGCRDATQVTVEITLAKRATCAETNGTAITVGTDPTSTQQRVADEFVTATTTNCNDATHEIGTLVVTPGSKRASIVVVVAYDKSILPSSCKPPLFKGCIVARRQFTFSDHQGLHLPITIDPDCKDVPCDAFSTCRTGKCFGSDVSCTDDSCLEPGDPGDGGTNDDAAVVVDGSLLDGPPTKTDGGGTDGATDASVDAPTDGSILSDGATLDGGGSGPICTPAGDLLCPSGTLCNVGSSCCGPADAGAVACIGQPAACLAGTKRYCCTKAPCPGIGACLVSISGGTTAGVCSQ